MSIVGALVSTKIVKAPPESPKFPAASVILADRPLLPSTPQPEVELTLTIADPFEISDSSKTYLA